MKFRKKPVVIEAEQYLSGSDRLPFMTHTYNGPVEFDEDENKAFINTLEGKLWVSEGDWVIKGVAGEFYACKPDIFVATYEPVQEQAAA